jgi:hypothetical protein
MFILIKEFKYFNPKKAKKLFLSSKKYDPGCSSRIPDPDADFLPSRIPDPGIKKAPKPRSRIPDPDPQHWKKHILQTWAEESYLSPDFMQGYNSLVNQ